MDSNAVSQIAGSSNIVQTPTKADIQSKSMYMKWIVILTQESQNFRLRLNHSINDSRLPTRNNIHKFFFYDYLQQQHPVKLGNQFPWLKHRRNNEKKVLVNSTVLNVIGMMYKAQHIVIFLTTQHQ